jgi:lysophospholipase L1-like esterase
MPQRLAQFLVASALMAGAASAQPPATAQPPAGQPAQTVPTQAPPVQTPPAPTATATAPQPAVTAPPPHTSTGLPANTTDLTAADLPKLIPLLERLKGRMDDWPQLTRYQAANAQAAPPIAGEARVVFLGDSITDVWVNPKFGGFFPGKPYVDRGISAQTTPQMVLRMRADVLALKPKAMVLLAGTNDIAGNTGPMTLAQIEDNIMTIAELATMHEVKVVLASVLPTSNYHFKGTDPRLAQTERRPLETIRALNAWLKEYAGQHGHVYLDYYSAMLDASGMLKAEFSEDDLHPNAAGYAVMAPLAEAAIAKVLAGPASKPAAIRQGAAHK